MRTLLALLAATLLVAPTAPALAHPGVALDPTLPTDLTHASTDNVEYLGRFPEHAGTAGGILAPDGETFLLTDPRGVFAYDVGDPAAPALLDSVAVYQQATGVALAQEDPDTNGAILLVDGATTPFGTSQLQVVDVSDPADLAILAVLPVTDHTWTCVSGVDDSGADNGCAYAYGRTGHIIDLTDPSAPVRLPGTWRQAVGYGNATNSPYTHDLTEVRPGLVLSSGSTVILMDTSDPAAPVELTRIEQPGRFPSLGYHSVEWAGGGRDPWLVMGTEIAPSGPTNTAGSDCQGPESVIETWDAREVIAAVDAIEAGTDVGEAFATARFRKVDAFSVSGRGIFLDGAAPAHALYCAHWMELHPGFDGGGLVAVAYYDRGTRFARIGSDGTFADEAGWIVAAEGYAGSAQWVTGEIVYVMDYRRGLEVVRLAPQEATGVRSQVPDLVALTSRHDPPSTLHTELLGWVAILGLAAAFVVGPVRVRCRR